MHSESGGSAEREQLASSTIQASCKTLCENLNVELEISVLSASSNLSGNIQKLSQGAGALIINNKAYAESPDSIAVEAFRSFEAVAERGIPIVEVHEENPFSHGDSRPYLDSPAIGAGLVAGMGLNSYSVAIRALAAKLESQAL